MTPNFQTLHLFDDIHSNENKKYSFHIELVSKGTRLKYNTEVICVVMCMCDLNTIQCVSIAAQV